LSSICIELEEIKKDNRASSRYIIKKEGNKKFILRLLLFAIDMYIQKHGTQKEKDVDRNNKCFSFFELF